MWHCGTEINGQILSFMFSLLLPLPIAHIPRSSSLLLILPHSSSLSSLSSLSSFSSLSTPNKRLEKRRHTCVTNHVLSIAYVPLKVSLSLSIKKEESRIFGSGGKSGEQWRRENQSVVGGDREQKERVVKDTGG